MLKSLQGLCKTATTANSRFRIIYARCCVLHRLFLRKQYLIIVDNYSCQLGDICYLSALCHFSDRFSAISRAHGRAQITSSIHGGMIEQYMPILNCNVYPEYLMFHEGDI